MNYQPNRRILVVDDEPDVLELLRVYLKSEPFEVAYLTDAVAALKLAREQEFAVVLCDMRMPAMSGSEFLSKIREFSPASVRINMSSHADMDMVIEALETNNLYDFFKKPLKREKLVGRLHKALEKHNIARERDALAVELAHKNRELERWNHELDVMVLRRTRELDLRDQLLQHIAGAKTVGDPIAVVEEFAREFFPGRLFALYSVAGASFALLKACGPPQPHLAKKPRSALFPAGEAFSASPQAKWPDDLGISGLPCAIGARLSRHEATLGFALLAGAKEPGPEERRAFDSLIPLLNLLVYDRLALERLDEIDLHGLEG